MSSPFADDISQIDGSAGGRTAAPDFQITVYQGADVVGGDKINLSDVLGQGKPVVLNFWAGFLTPAGEIADPPAGFLDTTTLRSKLQDLLEAVAQN